MLKEIDVKIGMETTLNTDTSVTPSSQHSMFYPPHYIKHIM